MKEKIRSLVNKTYIIHAIFILSMTQSFALVKIFWLGGFIHDGSFSEFAAIIGSVIISVIALLCFICLIALEHDGKKRTIKDHIIQNSLYLIATVIIISIVNSVIDRSPEQLIWDIATNTSYIYDIVFNKVLYIIDMVLICAIYMTRKFYKIWNFLLEVLIFKVMFMVGVYFATISYLNIYNSLIDKNPNAFIPTTFYCQDTYVNVTNVFLIENKDCPFKDSKDVEKELAKSGSAVAYDLTIGKPMDIKEKAAIVIMFYEANKKFEETTWIERNLPSVYQTSTLYTAKIHYQKNKEIELSVAKLILSGQETAALEKARETLTKSKSSMFLYYLINEKK